MDHGSSENKRRYGSAKPKSYALENLTQTKTVLFRAEGDVLSVPKDVDRLKTVLRSSNIKEYLVPDPEFGHMSYLVSEHAGRYVNKQVLDYLGTS